MTLGDMIKEKREKQRLTQKQLADKVYSTPAAISQFERGKHLPKTEMMYDLSEVLDIPVELMLFEGKNISTDEYNFRRALNQREEEISSLTGYHPNKILLTPAAYSFYRNLMVWNPAFTPEKCIDEFFLPYLRSHKNDLEKIFILEGEKSNQSFEQSKENICEVVLGETVRKVVKRTSEDNILAVGCGGSCKTRSFILPNITRVNGDSIIIDPNGEYYNQCKEELERKGTNAILLDFKDFEDEKVTYNPFLSLKNDSYSISAFVDSFFGKEIDEERVDPFWVYSEKELMQKCIEQMFETCEPKDWNFETFKEILKNAENDKIPMCPEKTFMAIKVSLAVRIDICNVLKVANFLNNSPSSIDFESIFSSKRNNAVFLKISVTNNSFYPLVRLAIADAWMTKARMEDASKALFFFLDEYPAFDFIGNEKMRAGRKFGIHIYMVIQSILQLSKQEKEFVLSSVSDIVFFGGTELSTIEYISKRCGVKESENGIAKKPVPILSENELARLPMEKCVILSRGSVPKIDKKYGL